MAFYLLKSTLCLTVFFLFYKGVLEQTSSHNLKRYYIITTILLSVLFPLITFTTYVTPSPAFETIASEQLVTEVESGSHYIFPWSKVLWGVYLTGIGIFSIRFITNLRKTLITIRRNKKIRFRQIINVLLPEKVVPHTFFNYVFFNKEGFETGSIPREVILHETAHAREKHSIDLLIIEFIRIVFWFNPIVHFMRQSAKLNHEFLADRSVLRQGTNPVAYQKTILAYSSPAGSPVLANSINYSSIKKRFKVMQTQTPKRVIWARSVLLLPLLAFTLFSFSTRETIPLETEEIVLQQSASREEMKEYDRLAKKYNRMDKNHMNIVQYEVERLKYIYEKMSKKQRADAEPFPKFPPPPPAPAAPEAVPPTPAQKAGKPLPPPPAPDTDNPPKPINPDPPVPAADGPDNPQPPLPPPPPPYASESKLDHVIRMAKQNAAFFYEDKRISSDEAISLLKKNGELNLHTKTFKNSNPIVNISKLGFTKD